MGMTDDLPDLSPLRSVSDAVRFGREAYARGDHAGVVAGLTVAEQRLAQAIDAMPLDPPRTFGALGPIRPSELDLLRDHRPRLAERLARLGKERLMETDESIEVLPVLRNALDADRENTVRFLLDGLEVGSLAELKDLVDRARHPGLFVFETAQEISIVRAVVRRRLAVAASRQEPATERIARLLDRLEELK